MSHWIYAMPARPTKTTTRPSTSVRRGVRVVPSLDAESCFVSSTPAVAGPASNFLALTSPILSGDEGSPQWISGSDVVFKTPKAPSPARTRRRTTMVNFRDPFSNQTGADGLFKSPPGVKTRSRRSSIYVPVTTKAEEVKSSRINTRGLTRAGKAGAKKSVVQLSPGRAELALQETKGTITQGRGKKTFTNLKARSVAEEEFKENVEETKPEDDEVQFNVSKSTSRKRKGVNDLELNEKSEKAAKEEDVGTGTPAKENGLVEKEEPSTKRSRKSTRMSMSLETSLKMENFTITPKRDVSKKSPHPKKVNISAEFQESLEKPSDPSENQTLSQEVLIEEVQKTHEIESDKDCWQTPSRELQQVSFNTEKIVATNEKSSKKESIRWKSPALNVTKTPLSVATPTTAGNRLATRRSTPWNRKSMQELQLSTLNISQTDDELSNTDNNSTALELLTSTKEEPALEHSTSVLEEQEDQEDAGNTTLSHTGLSQRCTIL